MAAMRMLGCRGLRRSFGAVAAVDGWGSEGDGGEVVAAGEPVAAMPCRGGDGPAARGQECTPGPAGLADGAALDELQEHIVFLRSLGAPGGARLVIGLNDDDARASHRRRAGLGRGGGMQTVTLGAAGLQVSPMAWPARAGGGHAL